MTSRAAGLAMAVALALASLSSLVLAAGDGRDGRDGRDRSDRSDGVQRVVDHGIAVELSTKPQAAREREPIAFSFSLHDNTTGAPLTGAQPAAWVSARDKDRPVASGPDCVRKAATFLGGSLTRRPAADLNQYYVLALNDEPSISVVDPRFGYGGSQLLALLTLESRGEDWALTADGARLFVSMPDAGKIAVADTTSWKVERSIPVGPRPTRVALQPDGARLWTLTEDAVVAIDPRSLDIVARIAAPAAPAAPAATAAASASASASASTSAALAFTTDSRFAVAALPNALLIIDTRDATSTRMPIDNFTPRALAFSSVAQLLYAADPATGAIVAIDVPRRAIAARIADARPGLTQLRFSPDGRYGFLPNPTANVVQIFDTATNRIIRTASISDGPDQVTFSDRLAYIRRRASDTILMLPLAQLATNSDDVSLADFTGGQHAMGRGRTSAALADSIVPAPDGLAVLVANPADRAIYYYKEGMAAPMGGFNNYSREPRAVLVVDRSLRARGDGGIYATTISIDEPGSYDVILFVDSPRIVTCFGLDVAPRPELHTAHTPEAIVEPVAMPRVLKAGAAARLQFRLSDAATHQPIAAGDVEMLAMQAPGIWQHREAARAVGEGIYEAELTPPSDGVFYVWVTSARAGLPINNRQFVVLRVE
jgi:DNA-binding beta-propeller fold protein YncE